MICKVRDMINNSPFCIGSMNGCIVNCFNHDSVRQRPHSDNEHYIDQTHSISTFSLGATREFGIYNLDHKEPKLLKSMSLQSNSVTFMHWARNRAGINRTEDVQDMKYTPMGLVAFIACSIVICWHRKSLLAKVNWCTWKTTFQKCKRLTIFLPSIINSPLDCICCWCPGDWVMWNSQDLLGV